MKETHAERLDREEREAVAARRKAAKADVKPNGMRAYVKRFHANEYLTGHGESTTTHCPCPFCGAIDWLAMPILKTKEALSTGATCGECGRSAKAIFDPIKPHEIKYVMVQTGGDDPPDWLVPKMRRVERPGAPV